MTMTIICAWVGNDACEMIEEILCSEYKRINADTDVKCFLPDTGLYISLGRNVGETKWSCRHNENYYEMETRKPGQKLRTNQAYTHIIKSLQCRDAFRAFIIT